MMENFSISQEEMELIAGSVLLAGNEAFKDWQDDVNNLGKQFIAEGFRHLIQKLAQVSSLLQTTFGNLEEQISQLSEEEREQIRSQIKVPDIETLNFDE